MSTIAFWKPYNVLSKFSDHQQSGTKTLAHYIDLDDVYGAGRLDKDSEGLLILSADKRIRNAITNPTSSVAKLYLVQVEGVVSDTALERLENGLLIQGKRTKRCRAKRIHTPDIAPRSVPIRVRKNVPDSWLAIELREGRNRQVRRMCAAVGHPCLRLVRHAVGSITLDGLEPGRWRELSSNEIESLLNTQ